MWCVVYEEKTFKEIIYEHDVRLIAEVGNYNFVNFDICHEMVNIIVW